MKTKHNALVALWPSLRFIEGFNDVVVPTALRFNRGSRCGAMLSTLEFSVGPSCHGCEIVRTLDYTSQLGIFDIPEAAWSMWSGEPAT